MDYGKEHIMTGHDGPCVIAGAGCKLRCTLAGVRCQEHVTRRDERGMAAS